MASKQRDMADSMHYESRQIRDELQASHARLKSARSGRLASDLQPQQGALMMQEWEGLSSAGDLDNASQGHTLASGNPQYEQMRAALLAFERELGYSVPARERAFFSALRTQLMEAGAQRDNEQRNMHIAATFKWFARHKPQGPEADPITAAVLASSLAVEAVGGPPQPPDPRQAPSSSASSGQLSSLQRMGSPTMGLAAHSSNAAAIAAAAAGPPGGQSRHHFFDVYTRAPVVHTSATAAAAAVAVAAAAATAYGPGARGAKAAAAAAAAATTAAAPASKRSGEAGSQSLSLNHPLAMYPTVATGHPMRFGLGGASSTTTAPPPPASTSAAGSGGLGGGGGPRARFASTDLYAPGKLVRPQELDELDHRAAQVAAASAAAGVSGGGAEGSSTRGGGQLHQKPWIPGPHRAPVTTLGSNGGAAGGSKGGARRGAGEEEDEVQVLRNKWSVMEARTSQSVADVQSKLAEWTLQRARLEEEIVRRQEASRYAAPGGMHSGGMPWPHHLGRPDVDDGSALVGTLSPYANANADLAAATAAAATFSTSVNFMMPPPPAGGGAAAALGASMRMRHAEVAMYDRGKTDLLMRLNNMGLNVSGETLDRALRPVEDRPFLDCIARLPKPGEHLVSRPGSVGQQGASKKKRSKSSSKKRPTSGR
ncbi:hypothetical protein Agub_g1207 [Astrephomene gubernaculifera]|uniref:Uncharacterized protein n=1 Tax=Astrephomene gubernaculifera TaxID=47775 RepID=A0AAD3HHJ5_9CHLO|nr:hypothetical protein Agub_g1207 [Astrephomene gubernaculifera]